MNTFHRFVAFSVFALMASACAKISEPWDISYSIRVMLDAGEPDANPDYVGHLALFVDNAGGKVLSDQTVSSLAGGCNLQFSNVRYGTNPQYAILDDNSSLYCGVISSEVSSSQTLSSSESSDGAVLAGCVTSDGGSYSSSLKNVTGFVKFTIGTGGFEKVAFSSVEREDIAGTISIPVSSISDGTLSYSIAQGSKSIEVGVTGKGTFCIAVLPGKEFTPVLTFTDASGKVAIDTLEAITPERAKFTDLGVIDNDLQFGPAPVPQEMTDWEKQVRARADLIYNISWTPSSRLSTSYKDKYFPAGTTVRGAPYSSVWGYSPAGFVGYTISFYTFLSALNNANGFIYDIDYHYACGENEGHAGSMYGTVCSTTVMYVLGYPNGYTTSQIVAGYVPALTDLGTDFSDLRLCDAFCYNDPADGNGHTLMIYDLEKDASGTVTSVTVEEAWMPVVRRKTYTPAALIERLQREGEGLYRHFRVDQDKFCYTQPSYVEQSYDISYDFPSEICLSEGDRKSFLVSDTSRVSVNILTDRYPEIVLEKDGILVATRKYTGSAREDFVNLPSGQYRVYLRNGDRMSDATSFEMVGTLSLSASMISNEIRMSIPQGFTPISVVPVGSDNRPLLSTGKAKDGRWAFPIPEGVDASSWGNSLTVKLAGQYNMITYPTKIRYK